MRRSVSVLRRGVAAAPRRRSSTAAGAVSHDDIEHTKLGGLVKQVRKTRARTKRPPPRPKPGAFKTGTPAAE